jgi:DNA-binding response OmpR family regulator
MARVLIAEDDSEIGQCVQQLLDRPGIETIVARHGLDARRILKDRQRRIDLIILDLLLPRYSGWEILVELREDAELSRIPVIVLSALAAPSQNLGTQEYIQKPFAPSRLTDAVARLLGMPDAFPEDTPSLVSSVSSPSWSKPPPLLTHVLIVDDDEDIRCAIAELLQDYSFATSTARDGAAALELIRKGTPRIDLIVLDLMMPQCDGWDLLRSLREHPESRHVPVLVVSALSKAARDLNVEAFLPKPFDGLALVETIERLTNHSISAA